MSIHSILEADQSQARQRLRDIMKQAAPTSWRNAVAQFCRTALTVPWYAAGISAVVLLVYYLFSDQSFQSFVGSESVRLLFVWFVASIIAAILLVICAELLVNTPDESVVYQRALWTNNTHLTGPKPKSLDEVLELVRGHKQQNDKLWLWQFVQAGDVLGGALVLVEDGASKVTVHAVWNRERQMVIYSRPNLQVKQNRDAA